MDPMPVLAQDAVALFDPQIGWTLADIGERTMVISVMGMIAFVVFISIVVGLPARASIKERREREQTKREIAAYAAEGSIAPDEATRMIQSAEKGKCDWKRPKA